LSVRLLMLGLLKQGPLHGYEIKRIIETEMSDWSHVAVGSIYFALEKMAQERLIEESETTREGNRPSRTVYRITDSGRTEFLRLLRESWAELEPQRFSLDFGIAFMGDLDSRELYGFLKSRVTVLEGILEGLSLHEREVLTSTEVPAAARLIFSHHAAHYKAELAWTREVLASVAEE